MGDEHHPLPPKLPTGISSREQFFAWFHRVVPNATSNAFARGRLADGRSSYDLALSAWRGAPPCTIVDIGCGEGYLLQAAGARWPQARLVGVDIAAHEAEDRLARVGASFLHADAASLPIPNGSVDLALMHLSLPFVEDADSVLVEIARVLRPGGILSVIVGHRPPTNSVYQRFGAEVRRLFESRRGVPLPLVNRQTAERETLEAAIARARLVTLDYGEHELDLDGSRDDVWRFLATTYDWPFLDDAAREELAGTCRNLLSDAPLPIVCRFGIRHLVAGMGSELP